MKNNRKSPGFNKWMSHAFAGRIAVLVVAAGLSACNHAEQPPAESESARSPLAGIAITFDAKGDVVIRNRDGKPIGDQCSPDPKAPNVCPVFKPGHKVQVEQGVYIQGIRYHGSPECFAMLVNGTWYVLPSASFCNQ